MRSEALLNGRCCDGANRLRANNVVPNTETSTRQLPRSDVEVESGGRQHCASRKGILGAVEVRYGYDHRIGRLERPDLRSMVVAGDIRLQRCFAAACSLHLREIKVKQYKRRSGLRGGVYHLSGTNDRCPID